MTDQHDKPAPKNVFNREADERRAFSQALFKGSVAEAAGVLTNMQALTYTEAVRLIRTADLCNLDEESTAALLAIAAGRQLERVVSALDAAGPVSSPAKSIKAPNGSRLH